MSFKKPIQGSVPNSNVRGVGSRKDPWPGFSLCLESSLCLKKLCKAKSRKRKASNPERIVIIITRKELENSSNAASEKRRPSTGKLKWNLPTGLTQVPSSESGLVISAEWMAPGAPHNSILSSEIDVLALKVRKNVNMTISNDSLWNATGVGSTAGYRGQTEGDYSVGFRAAVIYTVVSQGSTHFLTHPNVLQTCIVTKKQSNNKFYF